MRTPVYLPGRHLPAPLRRFFATRHMDPGKEKDGHAIMTGSSEGRSHRGTKINGFGITDFRLPKAGSPTRTVGFGPPPPALLPSASDKKSPDKKAKPGKEQKP